jgi:hypothetical protein
LGGAENYDPQSRGRVLQLYGRRTLVDNQINKWIAKAPVLAVAVTLLAASAVSSSV